MKAQPRPSFVQRGPNYLQRPGGMLAQRQRSETAAKYTLGQLFTLLRGQDSEATDVLANYQKRIAELKKNIAMTSKKNFTVEREIRNLDQKIALLIRNRISLEEVMATTGDLTLVNQKTATIKDKREREHYGQLFFLLQNNTRFIAKLARLVKLNEIDNLLQTVMFTLYGNQYDEAEEHLMLQTFQRVLEEEFDEAKGIANLLRANTALTRMMTTYTRRGPGQLYLKATLTEILGNITSQPDLVLEINPLKVYEAMINEMESTTGKVCNLKRKITAEEAAAQPEVQSIIVPRIKKLGSIADSFLDKLIESVEQVPYGIRWICRQIRELCKEKFPNATTDQTSPLIGGFFLLRFINPAIVTPQAFMLVDTKLSANTRRNLTLLAKILQNLANNVQFGGVKEFFMAPLNAVLDKNRERVHRFFERLCVVEDLQEHLRLDKYITMGRTEDVVINISLNELYFIHSLLYEHLDILAPSFDDKSKMDDDDAMLRKVLADLGPPPPQLSKKDNANVDLKLDSKFKPLAGGDEEDKTPEQVYADTKYLLFAILKALPHMQDSIPSDINTVIAEAQDKANETRDKQLLEMVSLIKENVKLLTTAGLISPKNNYEELRKDAIQELVNYEDQIKKAASDYSRLSQVVTNVVDHHEFLKGQFEAYKEYLGNVRQNCASGRNEKEKKKEKAIKKKAQKAVKYSHTQLEKDGVIMESEVPEERRAHINFVFKTTSPGIFTVEVQYKGKQISDIQLGLDDLLELQHNNERELETDFLKLNVNLIIFLLNKSFISH
mmetsp:Transcript_40504/g.101927  ORF Transcript_40504/g.101927 Transcript_40504/m.101927 type:complete len:781 (-) Transcript_40504:174-2516(-)|eukprot:CAMPEP_0177645652 /NCGR_PEP_ID=MMETSP0447-20121125/9361_1 /TAXON_ID=0 /ORGANISM="Stygamoeba regulata, Strain BSH-02190019" /LENGTH=780 /DNA_ID=CAMNT_0019148145 /DNA_START=362 /DNA_END=2704 /DNA_ORIENTATION=-